MRKRIILLVASVALLGAKAEAQTAVAAAGGEAGTVSFTVGQTFVAPASNDAGSIAPGVQQAYSITIIDGIENTQITLEAAVYPNPVTDRLTLRVDNLESAALRFTLTDNNGRTIAADNIAGAQTSIEMGHLAQGAYFLRVDDGGTVLRTFKIVKK
ncbi:MAG: T9SS type A sorting domain-containing protein [Salinivirgaceae bacterium]|nr:T9SS type A sorting domain-containing protein [Salinivirgaceae bacterium]